MEENEIKSDSDFNQKRSDEKFDSKTSMEQKEEIDIKHDIQCEVRNLFSHISYFFSDITS